MFRERLRAGAARHRSDMCRWAPPTQLKGMKGDFMAVRLRMKKMGRKHQPFFRVVAVDQRVARDGKVIEYLGHYDPLVKETDARALLNGERIDYWLSVGAQPSEKVGVLIKKYGTHGTHLEQQRQTIDR